jgi:hypothetical protein
LCEDCNSNNISIFELLTLLDDKKAQSAKLELLNKAAEVLKMTLDLIQGYKRRGKE